MNRPVKSAGSTTPQATALRKRAEETVRERIARSPENLEARSSEEMRQILHELEVHQIELEMQNEELRQTRMKAEAARVRYFDLYDMAPVGYFTLSEKGLILEANLTIAALMGVSRLDLVGQPLSRFIVKEEQASYYLHRKLLFDTGAPQTYELRMVKKNGTSFWAYLEATAAFDDVGVPVSRVAVIDITARKRAEDVLWESEEKYRLMTENTTDVIAVLDMNLHFTYISPSILRLRGFTVEEAMQQTRDQVMTPESLRFASRIFAEEMEWEASGTADPDRTRRIELEEYRKDGSTFWVEINISYLRDKNGKPTGLLTATRDITERKRAEDLLQESEERFNQLARQSGTIIWEVDAQGLYTYVSHVSEAVLGYRPDEMVGRMYFYDIHPESGSDAFKKAAFAVFDRKEMFQNLENAAQTRDGRHVWLSTNGIPLLNTDGTLRGYRGSDTDITEHKRAEEVLLESEAAKWKQEMLRLANAYNRSLIEASPDPLATIDPDGRITDVNKATEDATGYPRQKL
ncbi:MAG: PAS domain S-box protein, partial [Deltaproteobacteria bacterium]